jgi:hypothetical protein
MATDRGETRAGVEPSVECGVVHRAMRGEETETVQAYKLTSFTLTSFKQISSTYNNFHVHKRMLPPQGQKYVFL